MEQQLESRLAGTLCSREERKKGASADRLYQISWR